eukprot:CAMPEP_0116825670 /NCGR_PEP_ID=MMETSP0418-20121206/2097_1 /TAXON_ID=1158023 /ORGANISM="Astrosyne radiata, Strain 13vi08-1A" /LENGTH=278 /DNA_ID=CAMNT_0004454209 /DNA_START=50 /DNA_END=886 /DNA_ORIENTATION=+
MPYDPSKLKYWNPPRPYRKRLGFCSDSFPSYIQTYDTFAKELFMMVGYTVANDNMAFYPPTPNTRFSQMCSLFMLEKTPLEKTRTFLKERLVSPDDQCVNVNKQLPSGAHATLSGGDWSGVGSGSSGESWDFQTCTQLVERIGFSNASMFPIRPWSLEWLEHHCAKRFAGVVPHPTRFLEQHNWEDALVNQTTSHILFTNGRLDGWSVSGVQKSYSPTLVALDFPNGAHHSDLSGVGPSKQDTPDIRRGFLFITRLFQQWLSELPAAARLEEKQKRAA